MAVPVRSGLTRLIVGYAAIVCATPYLVLKIVWLGGGALGVANPSIMHDPSTVVLNTATALMDVAGIAIALAFTHQWGLRIPAWIVLPPMWVAGGLLIRFVLGVPMTAMAQGLARESIRVPATSPVQPWVYLVVYTEFTGLGIGLMLVFVMYARSRWSTLFTSAMTDEVSSPTRAVLKPLAVAAAVMAACVGALHLAFAFGAAFGMTPSVAAQRTWLSLVSNLIDAAIAMAAAAGIVMMVPGWQRRVPFAVALALAWIGGGSLFGWGLWHLINILGDTALMRQQPPNMVLVNLASLFRFTSGLLSGVLILFVVAERHP